MDFLSQNITLEVSGFVAAAIAVGLLMTISSVTIYIITLKKKLNGYEEPRYGFLGKSIYPVISLLVLAGAITFTTLGPVDSTSTDIQASKEVSGTISTTLLDQSFETATVLFEFTPTINDIEWGTEAESFDVYWKITGGESFEQYEFLKSRSNPSSFQRELKKGNYNVQVTLVYRDEVTTITDTFAY